MNDKELVELILRGERDKFGELVKRYQQPIYRFLRGMGLDHDEAADVMQNAFIKAYDKLNSLRGGDRFRVWFYSIAANHARNYMRRRGRESPLNEFDLPVTETDPNLPLEQEKLKETVNSALAGLTEEQRKVVVLRIYENVPFKEVATICNMSLSNAKVTYHRALKTMHRWLKPKASRLNLDN